ncbi:MAG: DUF975 family protein [Lachnospiraceae bacterium]
MKRSSKELKALAREALLGQYGSLIGAMFLLGIFSIILESVPVTITRNREDTTSLIIQFVITLIISVLVYLLQIGMTVIVLHMTRRQTYGLSDLFYTFRAHPDRFIIVSVIQIGISMILQIPAYIFLFLYPGDTIKRVLLYLLLLLAGSIVSFIVLLGFTLADLLLIDNENLGAIDAIRQSWAMMHGNKGRFFYLQISFFGLALLCILTLGIGMLWLYPYMMTTEAFFYLDLTGEIDQPHYDQSNTYTGYGTGYDDTCNTRYDNTYGGPSSDDTTYGSDSSSYTYGEDNRYE